MPETAPKHPEEVVRDNCRKFLAVLDDYHNLLNDLQLNDSALEDSGRAATQESSAHLDIGSARRLWKTLNEYGDRLLDAGRAWGMGDWYERHPEPWMPIERAGFFPRDAFEDAYTEPDSSWGIDLKRFLSWAKATKKPFGFSSKAREVDNRDMIPWVIEDVRRDVSALMVEANEKISSKTGGNDIRPPLTDRERAVLDVIPHGTEKGLLGKDIVRMLKESFPLLCLSALTKDIMPKLVVYYGVRNRRGFGYFRP